MPQIIGYYPNADTWKKKSEEQYRKDFTHDFAISYLSYEIKESIDREIKCISNGGNAGFFAAVRFLFPEVSHLAHLYFGKAWENKREGKREADYTRDYMKKFNILSPAPGLYYEVFRNGLMHSHHPKWLRKTGGSWYISNVEKLDKRFGIFTQGFAKQIKTSIDIFIKELEEEKKNNKRKRLDHFLDALIHCGHLVTKKSLASKEYAKKDFSNLSVKFVD